MTRQRPPSVDAADTNGNDDLTKRHEAVEVISDDLDRGSTTLRRTDVEPIQQSAQRQGSQVGDGNSRDL